MRSTFFMLTASSCMLNAAYLFPKHCSWLTFLFLMPIFYCTYNHSLTFIKGFYWGISFFSIHFLAIALLLAQTAHGAVPFKFFLYCSLVVYFAVHAGAWFWLANLVLRIHIKLRFGGWLIATMVYFLWLNEMGFWIFGCADGYPFINPLIPLAQYPTWLRLLPTIGTYALLAALITGSWYAVQVLHNMRARYFLIAVGCYALFVYGWVVPHQPTLLPDYYHTIAALQPPHGMEHPLDRAQEINYQIAELKGRRKMVEVVIMPESSYPFALNKHPEIIELWQDNALADNVALAIGSCSQKKGEDLYNALFVFDATRITNFYVKSKLFPFAEYTPIVWNKLPCFNKLFLFGKIPFCSRLKKPTTISLTSDLVVAPYLCSEFFLCNNLTKENSEIHSTTPLLVLVNDSWFSLSYMRNLMFLFTRYTAIKLQRNIIYIGHYQGNLIDKNGITHIL